jgi:prophage tail gpP-like protein
VSDVELYIGHKVYAGWKSVRVSRSIERIAGSFTLNVSDKTPGETAIPSIPTGSACRVSVDGETVISGFVDRVSPTHNAEEHELALSGRDVTGDLVDCSAVHVPGEWHDQKLEAIVKALIEPFGISLHVGTDTGAAFRRFRIEEGETVFEAIDRGCRQRAVLPMSNGVGGLVLGRAGQSRMDAVLQFGVNVLSASADLTHIDRFSEYTVKGQQPWAKYLKPEDQAQLVGKAVDPNVRRYRPLTLIAEEATDKDASVDRAKWEANVRSARAQRYTVKTQGWRCTEKGDLWKPNRIVAVRDPWLGVDADLLITDVAFLKGDGGSTTALRLCPTGAFELREEAEGDNKWIL